MNIACNGCRVALEGISKTTAAGGFQSHPVTLRERNTGHFRGHGRFMKHTVVLVTKAVERTVAATEHTGGCEAATLTEQESIGMLFEQLDLVHGAQAAAMAPGSGAVGTQ